MSVDHRVRSGSLLSEVDQSVGIELLESLREELEVQDIADLEIYMIARDLSPPESAIYRRKLWGRTHFFTLSWIDAIGVRVSIPSCKSKDRRQRLSTMQTRYPLADKCRAVAHPQYPSPPMIITLTPPPLLDV